MAVFLFFRKCPWLEVFTKYDKRLVFFIGTAHKGKTFIEYNGKDYLFVGK